MTDRDRIYTAACKMPTSVERTEILEACARSWREERQPVSTRERILVQHYMQILRVIEGEEHFGTNDDSGWVLKRKTLPLHRQIHAETLALWALEQAARRS